MKARATLAAAVMMAMALGQVPQWTTTADAFTGQADCRARYRLTSTIRLLSFKPSVLRR